MFGRCVGVKTLWNGRTVGDGETEIRDSLFFVCLYNEMENVRVRNSMREKRKGQLLYLK
jgi:hypothetical protein